MVAAASESCPKCGTPRRGERACPRCGLSADRMAAFSVCQVPSGPLAAARLAIASRSGTGDPFGEWPEGFGEAHAAPVPEVVSAAWERVLGGWDEVERHDALLRLVAQHDAYAWAAGKYRDAKRAQPASPSPFRTYPDHAVDAIADRQLDRMRRATEATLFASATARDERRRTPYRASTALLALLIFAVVVAVFSTAVVPYLLSPGSGDRFAPAEAKPARPAEVRPPPPAAPRK